MRVGFDGLRDNEAGEVRADVLTREKEREGDDDDDTFSMNLRMGRAP